jgi:SpoVK/Ycf46/Vps4 family AAA+-type ATPase
MMLPLILTLQISAGDLSNDPKLLEQQLSRIFELADHWKALLLLDEADVYLRQRSSDHVHNSLVSVFLRKLEYYQGIMFLTTNRVSDFDEAMQSRIHLTLKYGALGVDTRKGIWKSFLETATTIKGEAIYTPEELHELARKCLNGREVSFVSHESSLSEIDADGSPIPDQKYCKSSACLGGP